MSVSLPPHCQSFSLSIFCALICSLPCSPLIVSLLCPGVFFAFFPPQPNGAGEATKVVHFRSLQTGTSELELRAFLSPMHVQPTTIIMLSDGTQVRLQEILGVVNGEPREWTHGK